ncbi:conserved hypothetical protein [Talaromyces marneffei ATCC 18224]|uniref:DUF7702 domain-containing protein n=1 Tax=Talaromyces marneffei (strain ATCC 18224 / CBS 334.59 / QM 7333) TaxID=441960 RepID=B6Q727_TALMQ|nr:conserved hypothetical protein [Talaromyces marneffei ATCC 18224]
MLNEHSKVSIAQIAFYGPAVIAAVALLLFRRAVRTLPLFPWIVLLIFTLVRLAGGIVVILYENQPSSNGLLIATLILLNVGVFPCIAATIGLINLITFIDFRKNKALAKIIICSRLLFLAGVAVLITGGCLQGSDSPDDQETGTKLVRIGYCIVTVFVACLLSFQLFFWSRKIVPFIVMALLMEYCVVIIYLYTGYKIGYPEEHTTRIAGQAIELKT